MSMANASGTAIPRFLALDSLRGICASMIVLLHFHTPGIISNSALVKNGSLFVDFFFVLSGFVISASYGDRITNGFSIGKFMGLRMGRIYPLHFFVLMVFLAFEIVFATGVLGQADRQPFQAPNDIPSLLASLFLVQTFIGPDGTGWNGPSWSIAVEMWTYLIFAFVFRWARPILIPLCLVLAALCGIYLFHLTDRYLNVFHDGALARCLFGFSLGVVAFQAHKWIAARKELPAALATVLEIAAIVITVQIVSISGSKPLSLIVPPIFFGVVLLFSLQRGAVAKLLLKPPFLLMGTLSYSIYMIHGFLEYRTVNALGIIEKLSHGRLDLVTTIDGHNQVGGSPLFGDFMSILMLAITIGFAYLSYRWIEHPAQQWSRRKLRQKPAAVPADPVAAVAPVP